MFKFKKGDKAKVTQGTYAEYTVIIDQDSSSQPWVKLPNGDRVFIPQEYMELSNEAAVYENPDYRYDRMVLNEFEYRGVRYLNTADSDDNVIRTSPERELADEGWKLKQEQTELTLAQVAEKFNISLDKLRIKE
jgi:hypothetical protein